MRMRFTGDDDGVRMAVAICGEQRSVSTKLTVFVTPSTLDAAVGSADVSCGIGGGSDGRKGGRLSCESLSIDVIGPMNVADVTCCCD